MPDGVFGVEVVTPEKALVAGPATAVMLRTSTGEMTVLNGHTALVGDVVPGLVRVEQPDGTLLRLAVHGGFIQVDTRPGAADDLVEGGEGGPLPGMTTRVTLLAGVTELAGDIDVPRAERAQEAAAQRVAELQAGRAGRSATSRARAVASIFSRPRRRWPGPSCGCPWPPGRRSGRAAAAVPPGRQSNEIELNSASFFSAWLASILRSVPDLERMTSDCVVAPNS